jgi:pyrroline-5-carboxylate reductase
MNIGFIGGGNMAEAMISAIIKKSVAPRTDITAADIDKNKVDHLKKTYGIKTSTDNLAAVENKDIVILAVKPQVLSAAAEAIKGKLAPSQLVISILAGKSIKTISDILQHTCIVRTMPNTPAQIGEGAAVWTATKEVSDEQKQWAASILGAMGIEVYADDEKYMDMATAVSGSGPAYVFLFIEYWIEAAKKLGFNDDTAAKLVTQTLLGSAHLLQQSGKSPEELRKMVTSPGGTTAEAISAFQHNGLKEIIQKAVYAAFERSKELGS